MPDLWTHFAQGKFFCEENLLTPHTYVPLLSILSLLYINSRSLGLGLVATYCSCENNYVKIFFLHVSIQFVLDTPFVWAEHTSISDVSISYEQMYFKICKNLELARSLILEVFGMEGVNHSAYKWVAISESIFCNTNTNNARSTAYIMRKIV